MRNSFYSSAETVELSNSLLFRDPKPASSFPAELSLTSALPIDSFYKSRDQVDPRVVSFMSEVTLEIERSKWQEKVMQEEKTKREKIREELEMIRAIEERILKQNQKVKEELDRQDNNLNQRTNRPKQAAHKKWQLIQEPDNEKENTKEHEIDVMSEDLKQKEEEETDQREGEMNASIKDQSRLSDLEVNTLLSRIHEYYERMQDHDQNQFFNSQMYMGAEKHHNIGRDLNLSKNKLNFSPKYAKFATIERPKKYQATYENFAVKSVHKTKKLNDTMEKGVMTIPEKTDYPRPMNLERRFQEKNAMNSPSRRRHLSTKGDKKNSSLRSSKKFRPNVKQPNFYKHKWSEFLLETLRLMSKGKLREAKETIEVVVNEGYDHSDAYFLAGEIDRQLGLLETAEEKLLRALTFQVFTPKLYFSLGMVYSVWEDYEKAIRWFKKFLFSVETPEGHFELAKALMENEEFGDAAIHYNRAVVLNPEEPNYYFERAKWYEAQGMEELARQDYQNILRIDPTYHLEHVQEMNDSHQIMDTFNESRKREMLDKILPY